MEERAMADAGLSEAVLVAYAQREADPVPGSRRALRVPLSNADIEGGVDEHGAYIRCRFDLPAGSFATTVMEEIMKTAAVRADGEGEED